MDYLELLVAAKVRDIAMQSVKDREPPNPSPEELREYWETELPLAYGDAYSQLVSLAAALRRIELPPQ
jgi:hypothetical protein